MMKENVEALKLCIEGWRRDLKYAKDIPDVPDGSIEARNIILNGIEPQHSCRLCEVYYKDETGSCDILCPVKNDTCVDLCDGSPYENVISARATLSSYFAGCSTGNVGRQLTPRDKEYLARNKKLLITYTEIELAYLERLLSEETERGDDG